MLKLRDQRTLGKIQKEVCPMQRQLDRLKAMPDWFDAKDYFSITITEHEIRLLGYSDHAIVEKLFARGWDPVIESERMSAPIDGYIVTLFINK